MADDRQGPFGGLNPKDIPSPTPRPVMAALQRVPTNEVGDLVCLQFYSETGQFVCFLEPATAKKFFEDGLEMVGQIDGGIQVVHAMPPSLAEARARRERLGN